jgi:hypothetical protein
MNLALSNNKSPISLIPYLNPVERGFFLHLTDLWTGKEALESHPFLQVVFESSPFSKILHTKIHAQDAGIIESVFMLIQKDHYIFSDVKEQLNNIDIENNWQTAFSFYSQNRLAQPPVVIPEQIDENGKLIPFLPLWYCRFKKVYFHPLCPVCGDPLKQCRDDDLLIKSGLPSFSVTLQRYLYCPCGADAGGKPAVFYARKTTVDAPANVKSGDDLIYGFGMPVKQGDPAYPLPCPACDQHASCFGPENKAFSRLSVFSFFPFYMIVFKASGDFSTDLTAFLSEMPGSEKSLAGAENSAKKDAAPDAGTEQAPDVYAVKKEIRRILRIILEKWQTRRLHGPGEDDPDTVIFPPKDRVAADAVETGAAPTGAGAGDLQRTVIISRQKEIAGKPKPGALPQEPEKTVIIARKAQIADEKNTDPWTNDSRMEKTVIITANALNKGSIPVFEQVPESGGTDKETVILKPKPDKAGDNRRAPSPGTRTDDDLEKTVIISPRLKNAAGLKNQFRRPDIPADDPKGAAHFDAVSAPGESLEKTVIITRKQLSGPEKSDKKDGT